MSKQFNQNDLFQEIMKAIASDPLYGTAVREFITEDLEGEAHNQLWTESNPEEMTLLKMLPRIPAKQKKHDFTKVTDYGNLHTESGFRPNGLPSAQHFQGKKESVFLKPYGEITMVEGLAATEKSIQALGEDNISDISEASTRNILMYKMNLALYGSDTRDTLNANRVKGIIQLLDEGTRTVGSLTPNSDVFVDLRGQDIPIDGSKGLRTKSAQVALASGAMRWLIMGQKQMGKVEAQLDSKSRYMIAPQGNTNKMIVGATVDGFKSNSGTTLFAVDNALDRHMKCGFANDKLIEGAPMAFSENGAGGAGTFKVERIAAAALPAGVRSLWEAIDTKSEAGLGLAQLKIVYHVVACNEVGDAIRAVSTPVSTIVAGDVAKITIAPRGGETSFKVYRGLANVDTKPANDSEYLFKPEFIFEIPNGNDPSNVVPLECFDENEVIAGTSYALAANIIGEASQAIAQGSVPTTLSNKPTAMNAMSMVQLTNLFRYDLPKNTWLANYALLAWVFAAEVTKPFQNVVYTNCGRKQIG